MTAKVHWSFWLVGVFTLIWSLLGTMNFFMQLNPEMLATMPENHRAIAENRPAWVTAAFGLAVFGGSLGSLLLLLRRRIALPVFVAAFIGVLLAMAHALFLMNIPLGYSAGEIVLAVILPIIVAGFLVWYGRFADRRGWLK